MIQLSFKFSDDYAYHVSLDLREFSDISQGDWYDKVGDDFYHKFEEYRNKINLTELKYLEDIKKDLDRLSSLSIPEFDR